jgi:hypothetical protein
MLKDVPVNFKDCPWRRTRMSPTKEEVEVLSNYLISLDNGFDTFLEFGCGVTTWYLSQLQFKDYVSVEEYEPAIEKVNHHLPDIPVVRQWVDIPIQKYHYAFVDSHAGGDAKPTEREKPLVYAIEYNLLYDDTIMIAHDHTMVAKGDISRQTITHGWHGAMNKYGWKLTHQIELRKSFGIYERGKS